MFGACVRNIYTVVSSSSKLPAPPAAALAPSVSPLCPGGSLAFSYLLPPAELFVLPLCTVCSFYLELPILLSRQVIPFYPSGQGSHILPPQRTFLPHPHPSVMTSLQEQWPFIRQVIPNAEESSCHIIGFQNMSWLTSIRLP